ncbi:MAG: hypothetical protein IJG13_19140, partial [Kiritimatiellae bacterium]|nr:hypothetical protein [Kiritimatiellia bacterium]
KGMANITFQVAAVVAAVVVVRGILQAICWEAVVLQAVEVAVVEVGRFLNLTQTCNTIIHKLTHMEEEVREVLHS